jgi:hypothetical protein
MSFKNKQGENGEIVRNKAQLVAQGFSQVEGLDFGVTFTHVPRFEAIRILLPLPHPRDSNSTRLM